jgi:hypothetical protein
MDRPAASTANVAWTVLLLVAVLGPLGFPVHGLPAALKGDEPGYYLLALSLWHDRDARVEEDRDLRRLFIEFPERTHNLWLVSPDDFATVYFGVPFLYPLLAAPAAGLAGARGMIALNGALFVALLWMGWSYLRRFNPDARAALYAGAFFTLSPALVYVFWLQGELLNMACLAGAFFLVLSRGEEEPAGPWIGPAISGALLACVVYSRPTIALLGLPLLWAVGRRGGRRASTLFSAGVLVAALALAGVSALLVGEPWVYGGVSRKPFDISSPIGYLERMAPAAAPWQTKAEPWTLDHLRELVVPWRVHWPRLPREVLYFFLGRHLGLLPYMPFAVISTLIWVLGPRRERWRLLLLLCTLAAGLLWVVYLPANWRGGGPSFGNRIFCSAYPAFLFLVTAVRPLWTVPLGAAATALFLGAGLLSAAQPLGGEPNDQRHTLGAPFRLLPREIELSGVTGYEHVYHSGASFSAHKDRMLAAEDELWIRGGLAVELWMITGEPLEGAVFRLRSLAPGNELELCLEGACESVTSGAQTAPSGERFEITLTPGKPRRLLRGGAAEYLYQMTVRTTLGEQPRWRTAHPSRFYVGVALTYLGSSGEISRPMYAARWSDVIAPQRIVAGSEVFVQATVRNDSAERWVAIGATRVAASYHWEDENGGRVVWDGARTLLPSDLDPGGAAALSLSVRAPQAPGRYVLALDVVRENLTWFSTRDPEAAYRLGVEVEAP